jgi:hypothetical protein
LQRLKGAAQKIQRAYAQMTPAQKARAKGKLARLGNEVARIRRIRRNVVRRAA